jgi:hypothetical protein
MGRVSFVDSASLRVLIGPAAARLSAAIQYR